MRDRGEHRRGNRRLDGDTVGAIEFFRRAMLCLMQSVPNRTVLRTAEVVRAEESSFAGSYV